MSYSAKAVANEFIELAGGRSLSPMKLLKLVYFAHGWSLALYDRPLITDAVEAWQYGPVISDLYREFKDFKSDSVNRLATSYGASDNGFQSYVPRVADGPDEAENEQALDLIRQVWNIYGRYSGTRLSNVTHESGSPWDQVYKPGSRYQEIPNRIIESYFKKFQARQ